MHHSYDKHAKNAIFRTYHTLLLKKKYTFVRISLKINTDFVYKNSIYIIQNSLLVPSILIGTNVYFIGGLAYEASSRWPIMICWMNEWMNRPPLGVTEYSIWPECLTTRLLCNKLLTIFLGISLVSILWRLPGPEPNTVNNRHAWLGQRKIKGHGSVAFTSLNFYLQFSSILTTLFSHFHFLTRHIHMDVPLSFQHPCTK